MNENETPLMYSGNGLPEKSIRKASLEVVLRRLLSASELLEIHGETDTSLVSFTEFVTMFDDPDWGFGIMSTLLRLETSDRNRH
nr:uncharacterized TPR repeat-containing protein At1g05150-like [Tanacetum cinerariifolium]